MNISKSHKRFSERLNNPRVLSNPEEFLGPNYEAVLNFWMILDGLFEEQWETVRGRYRDFYHKQRSEWGKVTEEAIKASDETIGEKFAIHASYAPHDVYYGFSVAYWATLELIGIYKILKQGNSLIFINFFLNLS